MIKKDTKDQIFETARVEEVVGEFVNLKKRGKDYLGLCPFHNEKTPSFSVSPSKGIYKCFGCGKSGNSVTFLMEHEHYSYPEALHYLADKYNIEIEEEVETDEQKQAESEKESLFNLTEFASKYYIDQLFNTEKGKAIGLTYFKQRGFTEKTIKKFQLGYSPDEWDAFTRYALKSGYKLDYLEKAGFTIRNEHKQYDRFRNRVMFPIHSLTGRILGFGGRILSTDKKKPKYVNSPESEIYNKSKILYGLFFAKRKIIDEDNCFLVEGYTDVISLHQAGIENVVASSGTSLTEDQIRLIRRYTKNITILFDGDEAGLKASFRGIDMILEKGMHVNIVMYPPGEDPDSYAREHRPAEVREFIKNNSRNFILYKANLLLKESEGDPVKKASLAKELVNSVALIPNQIDRLAYIKQCSSLLDMPEQALVSEMNKVTRKRFKQQFRKEEAEDIPEPETAEAEQQEHYDPLDIKPQEKELIRLLLQYGNEDLIFEQEDQYGRKQEHSVKLAAFVLNDLRADEYEFTHDKCKSIYQVFIQHNDKGTLPNDREFMNNDDEELAKFAIDMVSSPYALSENWEKNRIFVNSERDHLKEAVISALFALKARKIEQMIKENQQKISRANNENEIIELMEIHKHLKAKSVEVNNKLGRIITR
ncbi:MAG: DNA primase [Bacteroidales bacterium]|nr:DNA primase [Bacteroidales bacterium]